MADRGNELERVRAEIRRVMEAKGLRPKPLAKLAGLGDTSIRDLLDNEDRDIKLGTLHKIADALEINVEDLLGVEPVTLAGRIGAGGSIIFEEVPGETVPRPPGLGGRLEALEVRGDSMLPRYSSGDVVYIRREHEGIQAEAMGEFCAVRLSSGETYVKLLARGSRPGFFTLRSLNADDIEDVEIDWATPIIFVLPRAARRLMGM
jgi:phage repressor protein C with HTH and peptisase S24 domain